MKKEAQKREKKVTVRFTQDEYLKLKEKAEVEGVTIADIVRKAVLRLRPRKIPEECRKLRGELGRIGNNINQIARRANKNREVDLLVLEELLKIREALMTLVSEVL